MLAIIGTYRGLDYVPRLLESIKEHTTGISSVVFVDDSGDWDVRQALKQWGSVIPVGEHNRGYNAAMQMVVARGDEYGRPAAFIEEDFYFTGAVDFTEYADHLTAHPYLSQVVVQRNAWFPNELRAGGMLKALKARGQRFEGVDGYFEHTSFFSCNPAVWSPATFASGWPKGEWSENLKRDQLISAGYKFAITPEILCHHDGIRSGKDY